MRRLLSPWWALSLVALLAAAWVCWELAGWQWSRAHGADGSAQNYFYSVQWLVFAGMGFYAWGRAAFDATRPERPTDRPRRVPSLAGRTYVEPVIDDSDDPELAAYNAMLARLHSQRS